MDKIDFNNTTTANANLQQTIDLREDAANTLELLAERPQVNVERFVKENLKLTKKVVTQIVNVPVTLTQEILVIEHTFANPPSMNTDEHININQQTVTPAQVILNDQPVTLTDTPIEIPLSQQIANVNIETVIAEKVHLSTQTVSQQTQIPVTLRHEELVTEQFAYDQPQVLSSTTIPPDEVKFNK